MVRERPVEYFEVAWTAEHTEPLRAKLGEASSQTTFEYLTLYLSLLVWASRFSTEGLAVLGDNVSALACAISFKGKGPLSKVSRELACRKVRHGWRYSVAHVPSELNVLADALSRLHAPVSSEQRAFPQQLLSTARVSPPPSEDWWPASA